MLLRISANIRKQFSKDSRQCFKEFMALEGEVFREVAGRKTLRVSLADQYYFIKKHFGIGWREILKSLSCFRLPVISARQEYFATRQLKKIGIKVPDVVAYGVHGLNPAKQRSFIMTCEVQHQDNLETLCKYWLESKPSFDFKRRLIKRVADIARNMHINGINHRDFYLCHFLFGGTESQFELTLIDLHRVQIRKMVPKRWQIKDLAGLFYSATGIGLSCFDCLYFIKCYRQQSVKQVLKHEVDFWQTVSDKMLALRHKYGKYPR